MPQPPAYSPSNDLSDYATANPAAPYNAAQHDTEFENLATTLAGVLANLVLIQRDDGKLANQSVHPDALSVATKGLLGSWNPRGLWVTATAYAKLDMVEQAGSSYVCTTAHTSGTFNTDATAGKWITVAGAGTVVASAVTFTPAGGIAATNVQAAVQELDTEKAALAGNGTQAFSVGDATSAQHAVPFDTYQSGGGLYAAAAGTADALTATITPAGISALVNGMVVRIRASAANLTTTPTLNLTLGGTATGAKTIVRGDTGGALVAGNIAGSSHELLLAWNATADRWMLLNVREVAAVSQFAAGTRLLFQQNLAPTGWTKVVDAAYNDIALRVMSSGTFAGGGSSAFTTVFGAGKTTSGHSITQAQLPNVNFTVTDPGHVHTESQVGVTSAFTVSGGAVGIGGIGNSGTATTGISVASGGSGQAHSHGLTMDLKFADVIIGVKD